MLRYAHALPSEQRVQEMTDGDYLYCLLHEMLDREEALESLCPSCRQRAAQLRAKLIIRTIADAKHVHAVAVQEAAAGMNAGFDMARFARMKEGKTL